MGVPLDSSGTEAQLSLCFTALPVRKALKLSFRWKSCFWKGWGFWSIIIVCLLHLRKMIFLGKQNVSSAVFVKKVNFDILLQHWLQLEWSFYTPATTEHECNDVCMLWPPNDHLTVSAQGPSPNFSTTHAPKVSSCLMLSAQVGRLLSVVQVPKAIKPDRASDLPKVTQKVSGRAEPWLQICQMRVDDLIQVSSNLCAQSIRSIDTVKVFFSK